MVNDEKSAAGRFGVLPLLWPIVLAQRTTFWPFDRLDTLTKAKVLMALLALVILGIAAMVLVWLGGRWAKRVIRDREKHEPR